MILNYNGQKHLAECLPSALMAVQCFGLPCPVVVVDNCSTDADVSYIHSKFPSIEVYVTKMNNYCFSLNDAMRSRDEEVVILLNNDMRFDSAFITPLLEHFQNNSLFAVQSKVLNWDGTEIASAKRIGYFHHFWFYKYWDKTIETTCFTLDAGGGCAAFRRSMFLQLEGFDCLYHPAYWEDTDLSYRAWQKGWKVLYDPRSVIYHRIGGTLTDQVGQGKVTRLICRNSVLFMVKNCGDFGFLLVFLTLLPWRILHNVLIGNEAWALGIWDAIWRIPQAIGRRISLRRADWIRPDAEFLMTIKNHA